MIRATTFAGKTVAVFGLGSSGNMTARALMEGGAAVAAWDDGEAGRAGAGKAGVPLVDLRDADWSRFAALILAPGVPLTHPEPHWTVTKAKAAGVEVIGDVELFFRERAKQLPDAPVVAITGTNGKSTTTALAAHILRCTGRDVQMGGNIGVPVLALEPFAPDRIYVLELSSFQIDLTPNLKPTIGVLLNITPDHLDRHGPSDDPDLAMRNYAAIKARVVTAARLSVVGVEDGLSDIDPCERIWASLQDEQKPVLAFSRSHPQLTEVTYHEKGRLLRQISIGNGVCIGEVLTDLADAQALRGAHNAQNAAAAFGVCEWLAIPHDVIGPALKTYPGLPHRMEQVGTLEKPGGRILFINDSKATNADSTEKALASWEHDIFVILGGKPKEGGITMLAPYFPRITKAYLIGKASDEFAATLDGKVAYESCGTLDRALEAATRDALACSGPEPVVLLSPACASYDQFRSFEHRGDEFRRMVHAIPAVAARGKG